MDQERHSLTVIKDDDGRCLVKESRHGRELKQWTSFVAGLLFLTLSQSGWATDGYVCEIKFATSVNDVGEIVKSAASSVTVGTKFSVNRHSGEVVGEFLSTAYFNDPLVLYRGDDEWSFKSLAVDRSRPDNGRLMYISVKEYADGKLKPFWAHSIGIIFSGMCENI